MTDQQLKAVMPHCPDARRQLYLQPINDAMQEAGVDTALRIAAFVAQIAHESGELRYMQELADGHAYEGRKDLGNLQVGDGPRYKGRGPIQLTGRNNYQACGLALGLDLEGHPELACAPEVAFRTACWFWTTHKLNELADVGDFLHITKRINGGTNGLEQRTTYYNRALLILGAICPA